MLEPRHINLSGRKAFALCATVFEPLRCGINMKREPALESGLTEARRLARQEIERARPRDQVSLADFLSEALNDVKASFLQAAVRDDPSPVANDIATKWLSDGRCSECGAATGRRCDGSDEDAFLVENHGGCLREVKAAFARMVAATAAFYQRYLGDVSLFPKLMLQTRPLNDLNDAIPGWNIAFNASVRYEDGEDPSDKCSVITLQIAPDKVGETCLNALPYVLLHEAFCHGPQMIGSRGARPNPASLVDPLNRKMLRFEVDPLSEGWIDQLTPEILGRSRDNGSEVERLEIAACEALHSARVGNPRFPDYERIAPGVHAHRLVRWFYAIDPQGEPERAEEDFLRLSCELNVAGWNYAERVCGCNNLVMACQAYADAERREERLRDSHRSVIRALRAFRKGAGIEPLLEALRLSLRVRCPAKGLVSEPPAISDARSASALT